MNTEELKVYTEQVKELETRLYTNEKMHKEHMKILDNSLIPAPQKGYLVAPEAPNPEDYIPDFPAHSTFGVFVVIIFALFFIFLVSAPFDSGMSQVPSKIASLSLFYWLGLIFCGFVVWFYFYCRITDDKEHAVKIQQGQEKLR